MSVEPTVSNDEEKSKPWLIKPGQVLNPKGRPKGSRNKLGEEFVAALQRDFEAHGEKVIETVRVDKPDQYLKVIASILPKELNVNTNALGDMSDDELVGVIAALRALANTVDTAISGAGSETAQSGEQAAGLPPVH
jgi:hypothetical protein